MEKKEILEMTAATIGKDLLQALVTEIKLMPDVWPKLAERKQEDIIERLRNRVEHNVAMAVHLIASEGRTVIVGDLDNIKIKDGIQALFKISPGNESRHELFDSVGKACLLVVADARAHMGNTGEVKPEPDQRAMDLGHEYHDNDGGGMDGGTGGGDSDSDIVDAEWTPPGLPAPAPDEGEDDPIYEEAVKVVIAGQKASISLIQRALRIGYNRAARLIERMEKDGIVSAPDATTGARTVLKAEQ